MIATPASTSARRRFSLGVTASTGSAYPRSISTSYGRRSGEGPMAASRRADTIGTDDGPKEETMKALVYHGPGLRSWEEKPDPAIQDPTDIVVRIDSSTICGTDLHILKGDVPAVTAGHGARPRGRRHGRRDRRRRDDPRAGRPRPRLLHHLVRALPVLQGRPLRPLHRRRRLDLRPPDRRAPGRVRACAVRRHVGLQAPRRAQRRAGAVPRRHPSDRLRGRSAQRRASAPATRSRSWVPARSGSRPS